MLRKVGAKKRSSEADAKEATDQLAKLVAALRQMGGAGEAETELDKANAAVKEKDWTTANNAAQEGLAHANHAAQEAADRALDAGVSMMYDIERIGAVVDELQPMAQEGRALREAGKYLEQYRKGQELRAKAFQQGREHLEEHLQSFDELLSHDREEGVDTRSPEAIIEKARNMLAGGEVDFSQVADLIAVQAQTAREGAIRGEPPGVGGGPSREAVVEAEDREVLSKAVEESFRQAEDEIKQAQAIKGDVQQAERELARAKSAFDAGDLRAARTAGRRSIVAAQSAARRAMGARVDDAAAEVRKLRLAGVNVTEVRKMLATAKLRVAEGSYNEASGITEDLVSRATALREQQQQVLEEVEDTYAALAKITQMEVVPSDAAEPLEEARNYARRGDVERARSALKRAETSGREFWTQVTDKVHRQVREYVIEARDVVDAQINQARKHFQASKAKLDGGDIEGALAALSEAMATMEGAPEGYHAALTEAAEKYLVIEVASRLGIVRPGDIKALRDSAELRSPKTKDGPKSPTQVEADLEKHREVLGAIRYDFPAEQEKFVRAIRRTLELENEVEEGKKIGTDMSVAEELLFDARSELSKHRLDRAELVLKEIEADIVTRKDERINELLKDADEDLKNLRATGVYLDDVAREVREARAQHANRNYEVAVDLIQDAVTTALERQSDMEAARRELQRAESLVELGAEYAADMGVAAGLLDEARNLSREHDNRDARAVAAQAVGEAQTSLAKYIDLILEETERAVSKAEEEHGAFPEWRERLNESKRQREQGDIGEALLVARGLTSSIHAAADTIHEVNQKVALVESYIAWVEQYTKTVVMPRKLLEHAMERLESYSLEAAREAVNEAVQKAEEAQRQFIREVHEEAFELIDEYEVRGMQLTEARNIMMQAQGLLESKSFEDSYKSAVSAQDFARRAYDLFQKTQAAVGELEAEVERMQSYGVDVSSVTQLLEEASSEFAAERYEAAGELVARGKELVPGLKEGRTKALEAEVREALDGAREVRGVNLGKFEKALAKVVEAREADDVALAIELLAQCKQGIDESVARGRQVADLLAAAAARAKELAKAGVESRSLEDAGAIAERRLEAFELGEAASILKRAMDEADKGLRESAEQRLADLVAKAIELRLEGLPGESALEAVGATADALLRGEFPGAVKWATQGEEALATVPARTAAVRASLSRARVTAARLREEGEAETGGARVAAVDAAVRVLEGGDLAGAEEQAAALLGGMVDELSARVEERLRAVESQAQAAEAEGADPTAAIDAIRHARTALKERLPVGAEHWAVASERRVAEARADAARAAEAQAQAAALLEDVTAFGADPEGVAAAIGRIEEAMQARRHKRALEALAEAEKSGSEAKKAHLDGRKAKVVASMQRAAKLGVPQDGPRERLAAIERQAAEGEHGAAFEALEALEAEMEASLKRRDELAAEFEAANDLETSFSDLPADFSACREARLKARDALERFDLDGAQERIRAYRDEVEGVLSAHAEERIGELASALSAVGEKGLPVPEVHADRQEAQEALDDRRWRDAVEKVDRGLERLEEAKQRLAEVQSIAASAEVLVGKAAALEVDMAEVLQTLETAKAKMAEGALEEAKVEADYALKAARGTVAAEVERRVDEAATRLEEAAEAGIALEPERGALRKAKEAAERGDFAKLVQAVDLVGRSVAAKVAERDRAVEAVSRLRGRLEQLEQFEVKPEEFQKDAEGLDRLEAAHEYKRLIPLVEGVEKRLAARLRARVDDAIGQTNEALTLSTKSKLFVGDAPRALERARKLAAEGEYLEAYRAARQAESAAYENKERHDRAKQLLRNVEDHLSLAASMGVETADLEALRMQALDAFEFQSYDEASSLATDAQAKITARLKSGLEERLGKASSRIDAMEQAGASLDSTRAELEVARTLMDGDDLISAEVALGGTERRIEAAAQEFAKAREVVDKLSALIDVADLLGVDAKAARAGGHAVDEAFHAGRYDEAKKAARAARAELAKGCAAQVEKRIEAAREVMRSLEGEGIPIQPAMEPVGRATDALVEQDFVGAFSAAREATEAAEKQRRAYTAARDAIRAARRRLRIAEGLSADAGSGQEALSESEILFRSGDYEGSSAAASNSAQALAAAAGETAGLAISEAERSLDDFRQSGVSFPPAADSLSRSREALALDDFLGSVHYARMASKQTEDARRLMEAAQVDLAAYSKSLDRAEGLLDLTPEDHAALEQARSEFQAGQMKQAQELVLKQQQDLHARARASHDEAAAEVEALAAGLERMGFDAGPARNEAKESAIALEEGRVMDALAGVVGARTFARDQLAERVGARGQELKALLGGFEGAGLDVAAAGEALSKFEEAAAALDAKAAADAEAAVRKAAEAALESEVQAVVNGLQRAGEQRYFRKGAGSKAYQKWRSQAADLRGVLKDGDFAKALGEVTGLKQAVEAGLSELLSEKLVEIDALREVHLPRRESTEEESALYGAVVEAADRGRATLEDLEKAEKLDQVLRDWSSKFVTDAKSRVSREMMLFEDKEAVEQLKTRLVAVDRARASPAGALQAAYELMDAAANLFRARAERLVEEARKAVEATRAVEADHAAVQDFLDRADLALLESEVSEAIEFAESALKEAARLQEAQVLEVLKHAKHEYEAAPDGPVKDEAKRYLQESLQARQTKEFEAAYDFARKSREVLLAQAREAAGAAIAEVEAAASALEAEGVDAGDLREALSAVAADFDAWEPAGADKRLKEALAHARGRATALAAARQAADRLAARVERARGEKVDTAKAEKRLETARGRMKAGDFGAASKEAAAGSADLDKVMLAKLKALVTSAKAKVKHNRNLEIPSAAAEELLASAEKLLKEEDIEGAFDAATRAVEEAEQAKDAARKVRQLGEQGTELLEKAAESGVEVSGEQEQVIYDAAKGKLRPDFTVAQLEAFIEAVRGQVGVGAARLALSVSLGEPPVVNRTNNAVLEVENLGEEAAEEVDVSFSGELTVRSRGGALGSVAPGESKSVELQFLSRKMGKIPLRVLVAYKDPLTGNVKRRTERRWVTLFDPNDTQETEQFYRRAEKCLVCVGDIPPAESMKVCECQSTFHVHCAAGVKDCPKCGRSLDEA